LHVTATRSITSDPTAAPPIAARPLPRTLKARPMTIRALPGRGLECPVATLAAEAVALIEAHDQLEERTDRTEAWSLKLLALSDQIEQLERLAATHRATSGTGALFQLHVLCTLTDAVTSWTPEGPEQVAARSHFETIQRLCYSLQGFIEQMSGTRPEAAGSDHYLSRRGNPFEARQSSPFEHITGPSRALQPCG
jgi:hypothetical protein